jgi:hypothetical protein
MALLRDQPVRRANGVWRLVERQDFRDRQHRERAVTFVPRIPYTFPVLGDPQPQEREIAGGAQ